MLEVNLLTYHFGT